jgi:hypothetical protein
MPIKRGPEVTIESVTSKLKSFERRYELATDDFVKFAQLGENVRESDAIEWLYLAEQLRVLSEDYYRYNLHSGNRGKLSNIEPESVVHELVA